MSQFRGFSYRLAGVAFTLALATQAFPDSHQYSLRQTDAMDRRRAVGFVANRGQAPGEVLFLAQGQGFQASFERESFVLGVLTGSGTAVHMVEQRISLVGAGTGVGIEPLDKQAGAINYFRGNDPKHWIHGLATYARLRYRNVYPGIDLLFYDNHGKLEYDFVVARGADPSLIRLRVEGGVAARVTANGEWQAGEGADAVLHRPLLYQNLPAGKRAIEGRFVERGDGTVGFQFAKYDTSRTLVIDPTINLLYSTYLGGVHDDDSSGITLDAQGNVYIVGISASQDYPVSANAYQTTRKNIGVYVYNLVITKMSPAGVLLYSTFVGGTQNDSTNYSNVLVDANGNAYLTGYATSADFPVTANAYQGTYSSGASNCAFLVEIGPDGSQLVYSSFFSGPGTSAGNQLAFNAQGKLYMVGVAGPGLPTTAGAYMRQIATGGAAFVAEFDLTQTGPAQLVAATYYGAATPSQNSQFTGNQGYTMVLDQAGNPWISGQSYTSNLPTTANALQPTLAVNSNCQGYGAGLNSVVYLAKLSSNLTSLIYGSYLSGKTSGGQVDACAELARGLAVDANGNLYITGSTASSTFPVTSAVNQGQYPGAGGSNGYVGFITKLSADGSTILWSSYLGGNGGDTFPVQVHLDPQGNVWVGGFTDGGSNFPITQGAYQTTNKSGGSYNGHLQEYSADGTKLLYGTYLGGSGTDSIQAFAFDALGNIYLTGDTTSTNFPLSSNAFQPLFANGDAGADRNDIFFTILGTGVVGTISPASGGNTGDTTITITGTGFEAGATCALQGATTIAATAATVANGGTSITCSFALNGVSPGGYSVVVTNPGGVPLVIPSAFTVVSGGQPNVWSSVSGRSIMRVNTPSTFYVTYGNSGPVDAFFTVLWIVFPSQLQYNVLSTIGPTPPTGGVADLAITDPTTGFNYLGLLLPYLPAGSSYALPIQFTDPNLDSTLALEVYTRAPWFDSSSSAIAALQQANSNPAGLVTTCVSPTAKPYLNNCLGDLALSVSNSVIQLAYPNQPSPLVPMPSQYVADANSAIAEMASMLLTALTGQTASNSNNLDPAALSIGQPMPALASGLEVSLGLNVNAFSPTIGAELALLAKDKVVLSKEFVQSKMVGCAKWTQYKFTSANGLDDLVWELDQPSPAPVDNSGGSNAICPLPGSKAKPRGGFAARAAILPIAASSSGESCSADSSNRGGTGNGSSSGDSCSASGVDIDPNDKNGPLGDGSAAQYVRLAPLSYSIGFENEAAATLPAQQVVVTDQLDPTKVDLTTVTLGPFAFGSNLITVPSGVNNYATTFAISSSLEVRIQGSLNSDTGLLKWTFTSIDPSTGLAPSDLMVGFLPPDADGVEGQGAVQFTVAPKSTDTTGTQITNLASVVFDENAPILTPTFLNTIDVTPPTSSVQALPATETQATFTVSWSGADQGSGVATYNIYVSDNGGPFTIWQSFVTVTSASYTGVNGNTYGFYSIAIDAAGNVQAAKSVADTATTVAVGVVPAAVSVFAPAQGATAVSTTTSLAWGPVTGATTYNVYFGTSTPPPQVTSTSGTSYSPTLSPSSTYYWSVTAVNAFGSTPSAVWSFTTASANACSFSLTPGLASLPATGTSTVETCPNNSGQPNCGVYPDTPQSFTVMPSAACGPWTATSSSPGFLQVLSGASGSGVGSVSFAQLTNTHNGQQSNSITVASATASATYTVTEAGNPDSQTYREIYALYEQFLGREPDAGGFAFWSGAGGAGLGQMADDFLTSPEFFNSGFAVMAAYQAATGAPPLYAQYTVAAAAIRAGEQTVPGLFNSLIGSGYTSATLYQNLLNRVPGTADGSCVSSGLTQCFQTIVGYPANTTPVSAPNNEFQSTGTYHTTLAADHTNALYVTMVYFVTVNRDPDPGGFTFWLGIANMGGPGLLFQGAAGYFYRDQILGPGTPNQGFIGSPEFQGLFAN